jgi:hypothetical protein
MFSTSDYIPTPERVLFVGSKEEKLERISGMKRK